MPNLYQLDGFTGVWRIEAETNGYLIYRENQSLLIDCPVEAISALLLEHNLALPTMILHTQVQAEHCREWAELPEIPVYVPAGSEEIAKRSEQYYADCVAVWPPDREWDYRGEEKYGIGGSTNERPPEKALCVQGILTPGDTFRFADIALDVVALPSSGKYVIGLYWRQAGILFSGDLMHAGGYLVNLYDLERSNNYLTGYDQLRGTLEAVEALAPAVLLPTTGPIITDPATDITALRARITWLYHPPKRRADMADGMTNFTPTRQFGRFREILPGLYQNNNNGNMIVYIDAEGRGIIIDPDPCIWLTWEENCRHVHADLDLLEREAGLKRVELTLITHYHGDHMEYSDLLRARYGTEVLATPDVAALMERPNANRFPFTIDWYGLPFDHILVDRRMTYGESFDWHGITITPIHTPGHCYAHTGYVIPWQGKLTVCTGDTFQYGAGPIACALPSIYSDTAWPDRSMLVTLRKLVALQPDYIVGAHSRCCYDPDGAVVRDWIAVCEEAIAHATGMLPPHASLLQAMTPPGYDEKRMTIA